MASSAGFNSVEQAEDKDARSDSRELLFSANEERAPSSRAKIKLYGGRALVLIGGVVGCYVFLLKRPFGGPPHSKLHRDIAELHPTWINECGGYDTATLNDFNSGWLAMQKHGWVFSSRGGVWSPQTRYRPFIANLVPKVMLPHPKSYWGWDYPGNGVIRLRLHLGAGAKGKIIMSVGNAWHLGQVQVRWDHPRPKGTTIALVPAFHLNYVIKEEFWDRWNLTIDEFNPRGIIVINYVRFECISLPNPAPAKRSPTSAAPTPAPTRAPAPTPATGVSFTVGEAGLNACPAGFARIDSAADCEKAAKGLGLNYKGAFTGSSQPSNCYTFPRSTSTWFNHDKVDRTWSNIKQVCDKASTRPISILPIESDAPTATPTFPDGALLDRSQMGLVQHVAGATWDLKDVDCHSYTLIGGVEAKPWDGSPSAVSDRVGCANACLATLADFFKAEGCTAFVYPDPGKSDPSQCKMIKKIGDGDVNICELGLDPSYWSYHVLKEVLSAEDADAAR